MFGKSFQLNEETLPIVEDIENARAAGMDGHIAKPIDVAAMTGTIINVLSGTVSDGRDDK